MTSPLKILIIEDNSDDANLMKYHLEQGGIQFISKIVDTKSDFEEALESFRPNAILCDHTLPQFDSVLALKILKQRNTRIPFILVTGSVSEEFAVQMIQAGAHDYIIKDRMTRLPSALLNAIQKCRVENERLQYFERVIANETLFKKAEKVAHFGIWETDLLNGETKWSDETYRILDYEPGEVEPSKDNFLNKVHPEDRQRIENIINSTPISSGSVTMELRIPLKGSSQRIVRSEFVVERDENNQNKKLIGFNIDITRRKEAEINLLKSLKETSDYKYALDESAIVAITDQRGMITHANDNFCLISQYSRDELIGQDHRIINSGYHTKEFMRDLWVTIAHGLVWHGQIKNKAKDGTYYWVDTTIVPFLNEKKKPYQYVSIRRDITSEKISAENLVLSERKFRLFFETAPEAIFVFDIEKKVIIDFNENALELLKFTREELTNLSPLVFSPEIQPDGMKSIDKMTDGIAKTLAGDRIIMEWLLINKEGKEIYTEVRPSLLSELDNSKLRISVIDITERKNAEAERNKITADLFKRNKDLEQFTYIVSHNLRAPVANILGISEELNTTDITNDERGVFRNELYKSVKRLDEVIMDLNNILNINIAVDEKIDEVFFSQILYNVKILIQNLLENHEVKFITSFKEIPSIVSFKSYIHSIFYNLISNSVKYKRNDVPLLIEVKSRKENDKIVLTFKDNGSGIDLLKRGEQIFGLYKRFHSGTEGKGMGLFMVKTQVESLGGKISVISEPNKGAEFTIELPARNNS